ncbi:MAG: DUF5989 family protein [Planctomycetaceae bacterium]
MTEQSTTNDASPNSETSSSDTKTSANDFARQAQLQQPGLFAEFWDFLLHNKKWWLTPIIVVLMLVGLLVVLSSSAAAPFIYTLF